MMSWSFESAVLVQKNFQKVQGSPQEQIFFKKTHWIRPLQNFTTSM